MKVKIFKTTKYLDTEYLGGISHDVPEGIAKALVDKKLAEYIDKPEKKAKRKQKK